MPLNIQVKFLRVLETRQITPLGTNDVRRLDLRVVAATKEDLGSAGAPAFPRRPVLSPERRHHPDPAATRTARRHSAAVRALPGHRLAALPARHPRPAGAGPAASAGTRLARQRARAGPLRRARRAGRAWRHAAVGAAACRCGQPAGKGGTLRGAPIRDALAVNHGDIKSTLEALGIPRKTFYDKLQRHGIDRQEYTGGALE